jgi:hypothetical protein
LFSLAFFLAAAASAVAAGSGSNNTNSSNNVGSNMGNNVGNGVGNGAGNGAGSSAGSSAGNGVGNGVGNGNLTISAANEGPPPTATGAANGAPLGWNFFHALYCVHYIDSGGNQWTYVVPKETPSNFFFTENIPYWADAFRSDCPNSSLVTIHVTNSSGTLTRCRCTVQRSEGGLVSAAKALSDYDRGAAPRTAAPSRAFRAASIAPPPQHPQHPAQ